MEMTSSNDSKALIHKGRVFNLFWETVALPDGKEFHLDVIRHPGAAAIVPMTRNDTVIMIEQYRHAVGGTIWEIPAGTLDAGESPLSCARRELTEETGYAAAAWEKLGEITPVPGYSDERIQIFLATDLSPAAQNLDPDEVLAVRELPFAQAMEMITDGRIQDAKTICGLFMARSRMKRLSEG